MLAAAAQPRAPGRGHRLLRPTDAGVLRAGTRHDEARTVSTEEQRPCRACRPRIPPCHRETPMVCKVPRTHSPPREPHSAARPEPPGTPTKQSPSAKAACARGQPPADPIALQKALVHLVKHGTVKEVEQALASVSVRPAAPSAAPDRAEGGGSRLSTPYKVLHAAIDEQREDMVELLIAKGFDVLEEDESCYTALLCAAEAGNERLVYLIAEGWRLQNPVGLPRRQRPPCKRPPQVAGPPHARR
eukprot:scaffold5467_cov331-Prasinococcus_capsulatus_cf.AAC.3